MLRVGEQLGDFRIRRLLGQGGMGEVYEAFEPALGRLVALKLLPPWLADQPRALERFQNEAATAARLEHPHIVPIYSWGQSDDRFFFTMKLVRGLPLSRFIERRLLHERNALATTQAAIETPHATPPETDEPAASGTAEGDRDTGATVVEQAPDSNAECGMPNAESDRDVSDDAATRIPQPEACGPKPEDSNFLAELRHVYEEYQNNLYDFSARIGADLAGALAYAHDLGQIHRDLKPSNVMIDCHGHVYLIDFGLTTAITLDATRHRRGTLRLHEPGAVGPGRAGRADGHLFAGRHALRNDLAAAAVRPDGRERDYAADSRRLGVAVGARLAADSARAGAVIRRAMNPRAEQRYQTAAEMATDLRGCRANAETPAVEAIVRQAREPRAKAEESAKGPGEASPAEKEPPRRTNRKIGRLAAALGVVFALLTAAFFWCGTLAAKLGLSSAARVDRFDGSIENSIGMRLVPIRPGEFWMGEVPSDDDATRHKVQITKTFWLGVFEVTQGQYKAVMGDHPSAFDAQTLGVANADNYPVDSVSWSDAQLFCQRLSQRSAERAAGRRYRLPTEAEWEYACRAGTTSLFHFGDTISATQANVGGIEAEAGAAPLMAPLPIGSFLPNVFGLHDMHGNVMEWCADCYAPYPSGLQYDPPAAPIPPGMGPDANRVARGGCFGLRVPDCRSARRNSFPPTPAPPMKTLGFRVACDYIP